MRKYRYWGDNCPVLWVGIGSYFIFTEYNTYANGINITQKNFKKLLAKPYYQMKILNTLFYQFYKLMVAVGNKDVAEYGSILIMTLLIFVWVIILSGLGYAFQLFDLNLSAISNSQLLILVFLVIGFFFFLFIFKARYKVILSRYSDKAGWKNIYTVMLLILSILTLSITFYLMMLRNRGSFG